MSFLRCLFFLLFSLLLLIGISIGDISKFLFEFFIFFLYFGVFLFLLLFFLFFLFIYTWFNLCSNLCRTCLWCWRFFLSFFFVITISSSAFGWFLSWSFLCCSFTIFFPITFIFRWYWLRVNTSRTIIFIVRNMDTIWLGQEVFIANRCLGPVATILKDFAFD